MKKPVPETGIRSWIRPDSDSRCTLFDIKVIWPMPAVTHGPMNEPCKYVEDFR